MRRLAAGSGAIVVGFAVLGLPLPLPSPTAVPTTAPAPLPSIATTIGNLLSPNSSSGSISAPDQAPRVNSPAGSSTRQTAPANTAAASQAVQAASVTARRADQAEPTTAVGRAADAAKPAGLPSSGGSGGLGLPGPFAPSVLAALVVLLGFFGLRMTAPKPVATRRYRLRLDVRALAPGAPAGSAASAAICLLESTLPTGFSVRRIGGDSVEVEAPMLHRALLFNRLPEIAGRAGRVGLRIEWGAEPIAQPAAPRVRLAIS
ncbi:MAG TPA: hypothetical protein VF137_11065 [Candidatus Dormibacteraeota bacterium]